MEDIGGWRVVKPPQHPHRSLTDVTLVAHGPRVQVRRSTEGAVLLLGSLIGGVNVGGSEETGELLGNEVFVRTRRKGPSRSRTIPPGELAGRVPDRMGRAHLRARLR